MIKLAFCSLSGCEECCDWCFWQSSSAHHERSWVCSCCSACVIHDVPFICDLCVVFRSVVEML